MCGLQLFVMNLIIPCAHALFLNQVTGHVEGANIDENAEIFGILLTEIRNFNFCEWVAKIWRS